MTRLRIPKQARSQQTWNRLLDAAGELLEEVGVERISTNMVAERAGVTPPTLYHYFPDKYALLQTLGERLMETQNALVSLDPTQGDAAIARVLIEHVELTRSTPGGPWVTRMLRAVPQLAEVRLASHRELADSIANRLLEFDATQDPRVVANRARLAIDVGYAAVELALEEPELDPVQMMQDTAGAIRSILRLPDEPGT
ncbi:MAG: TetR/AcrR family transcriptional regulator [Novosphingobium sp.]